MEETNFAKLLSFTVITWLLVIFPRGGAIRCFECTSIPDSGCGEDFHTNYVSIVECDKLVHEQDYYNRPRMCKKEISKTSDGIMITRGCLMQNEYLELDTDDYTACVKKQYNQDEICRCETDLCNDANKISSYQGYFAILISLSFSSLLVLLRL